MRRWRQQSYFQHLIAFAGPPILRRCRRSRRGTPAMILTILTHTPVWVFGLFAVLLVFGLRQTRSRRIGKRLAFVLPLSMIGLSLAGIHSSFGLSPLPVTFWAVGLALVTVLGYRFFPDRGVVFEADKNAYFVPGSWAPLLVIMAIFFSKYAYAVARAFDAALVRRTVFVLALSLAYGCFSGYFSSRAANLLLRGREAGSRRFQAVTEP
jgi:hypothetical protein